MRIQSDKEDEICDNGRVLWASSRNASSARIEFDPRKRIAPCARGVYGAHTGWISSKIKCKTVLVFYILYAVEHRAPSRTGCLALAAYFAQIDMRTSFRSVFVGARPCCERNDVSCFMLREKSNFETLERKVKKHEKMNAYNIITERLERRLASTIWTETSFFFTERWFWVNWNIIEGRRKVWALSRKRTSS